MYEKLIIEIKKYNQKSIFKIRYRKLKDTFAIFLELHRKKQRKTIDIKNCFVYGLASTFQHDKKMIISASKQQELLNKQYEIRRDDFFVTNKLQKGNVITFFNALKDTKKSNSTRKSWKNTINHFEAFTNRKINFQEINLEFCEKFRLYLLSKVSVNATSTYFSIFKAMLTQAVKRSIISTNPASFVENPRQEAEREFLTYEELQLLAKTESNKPQIKNAFLFSCFTGMRISDIRALTWDRISKEKVEFVQQKKRRITLQKNILELAETASEILKEQRKITTGNYVFEVPKSDSNTNKHVKEWVINSGIPKHITFHCSRHTFATLCITYDVGLYILSRLLGHSDIKITQKYAKIVDKKKDEAVRKLPYLNLS